MKINELKEVVSAMSTRSAWNRGVNEYAYEMLEQLENNGYEISSRKALEKDLLNGADSWQESSWGGCYLIYDTDIAERLCTPSEYRKTDGGRLKPNGREEWLDTQARALYQAAARILQAYDNLTH